MKKDMKKITKKIVVGATILSLSMSYNMATSEAFIWNIVNGAIVTLANANFSREYILSAGNNPYFQDQLLNENRDKGLMRDSDDANAVQVADNVMNKLLQEGKYYIRNNSLPFRWRVIADPTFNAGCYPTDYIQINEGVVQACHYNEDMLAGVLGHEMTHGLKQHGANKQYEKTLINHVISLAGAAMENRGWGIGVDYGVQALEFLKIKNVDVRDELQSDREGFFILSSAGFNPGGSCAMLSRMKYYNSLQGRDKLDQEYDFFNPSTHPATPRRLDDASKLLYDYGMGHCSVKYIDEKNSMVYFDNEPLLQVNSAEQSIENNNVTKELSLEENLRPNEMAYLIAGGIAKAFHDIKTIDGWNFRQNEDNSIDYLDDNRVYAPLKQAIKEQNKGQEFQEKVTAAYINDSKKNKRNSFMSEELAYYKDIEERRIKEQSETKEASGKVCNGNAYINMHLTDLAEYEYRRAERLDRKNPSAKCGRALVASQRGDNDDALRLVDQAIKMDPTLGSSHTTKAMILLEKNDLENALISCREALMAKQRDKYAHKVAGDIFDANGQEKKALVEYQAYKNELTEELKKANMVIPMDIPEKYRSELI